MLPDGGVSTVGQGAAAPIAQACDIVLVPAKVLDLCLCLEAAVVVVYHLCSSIVCMHGQLLVLQAPLALQGTNPPAEHKKQPFTGGGCRLCVTHAQTCQIISSFCILSLQRTQIRLSQGKPIPNEVRGEERKLRHEVELEDDNTAVGAEKERS
eukprot:1151195-Pelagomonas_calceolata.AAC.5